MTATELGSARQDVVPAAQQPQWPDPTALRHVLADLSAAPPLTLPAESDRLLDRLAAVARGEAFLLQGGDCAETLEGSGADRVRGKLDTLHRMATAVGRAGSLPVVEVGRIAGQYAKPRSRPTETRDGVTLPSYRGDAVNGLEFTARARAADPERLRRVHRASAATVELIRSLTAGSGTGTASTGAQEFFTSHEALLLEYENAMTRRDPRTGRPYGLSGHMLWIGERTRGLDGAHVAFAARIANPIGVKLGPTTTADEVLALVDRVDPHREPGRLTLITRMGADRVRDLLPDLVEKVTAGGAQVGWVCDPMHGNTFQAPNGYKTRAYGTVLDEVRGFFEVHRSLGTHPGGLHIEFTGEYVTECVGGTDGPRLADLPSRYETACDPRLNRGQALELSDAVAELLRG
ncbi:3-deoxy-7-phosphoheptulonate synthase class II [Actinacidiphila sp. ITFR-21]|uniref:3-deoxy-7-phosphoheptulonate synthase class II n=1 Tax=Actinacidiphila sp. ITFR-21 TaxID=3075199 RepID=UPI00288A78FE|nr:3-deoxy-7-phosphoheptulonate synthase class II [Streptomyces sp. ITFR-21]WNI19871.1 3-deoxy-7-phosphoheptulonate synthase class II [Streptomyces sp. ITFR-21]